MVQGALTYSLGLEAGGFFKGIVGANQALELFKKGMAGVQFVMRNVFAFAHEAANLHDLSMRTGVAVGTLYQLRTAFEAVGVGAEATSPILVAWRRALGGTDEFGKKTLEGFKALKLDVGELRKMPLPEGLQKFFETIANMEPNQAMRMTSAIFPRGLAANIMQAARQAEEFKAVMESTRPVGEVMARVAKMADEVLDTWMLFKEKFKLIWGTIAEVIGPPILAVMKRLNEIDLAPFAAKVRTVFAGVAVAIQEQKLGEVLYLSLAAGLEKFVAIIPAVFNTVIQGVIGALTNVDVLGAMVKGSLGVTSRINRLPLDMIRGLGLSMGGKQTAVGKAFFDMKDALSGQLFQGAGASLARGAPQLAETLRRGLAEALAAAKVAGPLQLALEELVKGLAAKFSFDLAPGAPGGGLGEAGAAAGGGRSVLTGMRVNPLEAMGAIFPGTLAGMGGDAAAQTAANTRKTADLIQKNNVLIDKIVTALTSLNPFTRK